MNRRLGYRWVSIASTFWILHLLLQHLYGQSSGSQPAYLSARPYQPANLWMSVPVVWDPAADTVPKSVRQARDGYWDQVIGKPAPLTPATAKGSGFSEGVLLPNQTEIPQLPDRSVLIGTFTSYQTVLSASGRAIYTEATFLVSHTFEDASGRAGPGRTFVLMIPGGTVRTTGGVILSFLTQPRRFSVNVGRTYLLAMRYYPSGDFFMQGREWDVTDGVVHANYALLPKVPATLTGLTLEQLTAKLNVELKNK